MKTPLEMMRKAPSATNKQPWRAVVEDGCVHFFEQKTCGYAKDGVDIQKADLGIAGENAGFRSHAVRSSRPLLISRSRPRVASTAIP